jgi:circadian clock protein KaiC
MSPNKRKLRRSLPKAPTGIEGLDEVTGGGLPRSRTTLVCGKTLFGVEFLVRGALRYSEPGVCLAFDEAAEKFALNVPSLGFDLRELAKRKKLLVDDTRVEHSEIEEAGEYNLDGLFIRLAHAVRTIHAKRVVLDGVDSLLAGLSNEAILRSELRRLFRWLDEQNLTAVVTAERGNGTLTRHGLEEYIADCVILLDHRVNEQISTRRLRLVKYRGTSHGTDEYPYVIDDDGFSLLPITSLALEHTVSSARVSTGIPALNEMLSGPGFFRGSSILVSGTAGTGKSSIGAAFASAACARGEKCLYVAFEESPGQMIRNMRSVGINLAPWLQKGCLQFQAVRPTSIGLEGHLASLQKLIKQMAPDVVVIDPITSIVSVAGISGVKSMLTRLVDFLKVYQITSMYTSLTFGRNTEERVEEGVSSLMDTWIVLQAGLSSSGQGTRGLRIVKSRGMPHSRELRELIVGDRGIDLGKALTSKKPAQSLRFRTTGMQSAWPAPRHLKGHEEDRDQEKAGYTKCTG